MMKIDFIIFDFDGTLFDTKRDIAKALNYALKENGFPELDENTIWQFTGEGTPKLVEKALGNLGKEAFSNVLNLTLKYYNEHCTDSTKPIDNVEEFLIKTKHIPKIILSNKYKYLIDKILIKNNFESYFIASYGRENFEVNKPDPEPLLRISKIHDINLRNAVYIGDTLTDIKFSKKVGIFCCIIPSGASPFEEIMNERPDIIFYDYKELLKKIILL